LRDSCKESERGKQAQKERKSDDNVDICERSDCRERTSDKLFGDWKSEIRGDGPCDAPDESRKKGKKREQRKKSAKSWERRMPKARRTAMVFW
jgi:hypothetical protein